MWVFGCARKIRSNGKLFSLTIKYALWPCKSISVFILPSNHFWNSQTRKERNSQTRKERKIERKKDSWSSETAERKRERRESRESEQRPNPRRSGEIVPSSSRCQVLSSCHRSLSFSISLSLLNRVWSSPICLIADHSLADLLDLFDYWIFFVVVMVVWVVAFWWFLCCVVVGFVI